jgi:hypothetical protein
MCLQIEEKRIKTGLGSWICYETGGKNLYAYI